MSAELHVKGTFLEWDSAGGTTYVVISRAFGMSGPPLKRGFAETTSFLSTDGYREFIPGWNDSGEPTIKQRFHKTQFALLLASYENQLVIPRWRFNFPLLSTETTPSRFVFLASIMDLGIPEKSTDGEDVWENELTLKISGKCTFTAGS